MKKSKVVIIALSSAAILSACKKEDINAYNLPSSQNNLNSALKEVKYQASDAYVVKLNSPATLTIEGKKYKSTKLEKNGTIVFNIPQKSDLSKAVLEVPSDAIVDTDLDGVYSSNDKTIRMSLKAYGEKAVANPLTTAALEQNKTNLYKEVKDFDPVKAKEAILSENNKTLENLIALSDTIANLAKESKESSSSVKEIIKKINLDAIDKALESESNTTKLIEETLKNLKNTQIAQKTEEKSKKLLKLLHIAKEEKEKKGWNKKAVLEALLAASDADANVSAIIDTLKNTKDEKTLKELIRKEIKKGKTHIPPMPGSDESKDQEKDSNSKHNEDIDQKPSKKNHQIQNPDQENKEDNSTKEKTPNLGNDSEKGKDQIQNPDQENNNSKEVKIKASDAYVVALPTAATLKVGNKEYKSTHVEANGTIVFDIPKGVDLSKAKITIPNDAIVDADGDGKLSEGDQIIRMALHTKGNATIANPITTAALEKNASTVFDKIKDFDPVAAKEKLIQNPQDEHLKKLVAVSEAIAFIAHQSQKNDIDPAKALEKIDFDKLKEIIENNTTLEESKDLLSQLFKDAEEEAGTEENIERKIDKIMNIIQKGHEKYKNAEEKEKKVMKKRALLAVLAMSDADVDEAVAQSFDEETIKSALKMNATNKIKNFIQKHKKWWEKHKEWINKHQHWIEKVKEKLNNKEQNGTDLSDDMEKSVEKEHHEGKKAHEDKEQERNSKIDKKEQELPNNQEKTNSAKRTVTASQEDFNKEEKSAKEDANKNEDMKKDAKEKTHEDIHDAKHEHHKEHKAEKEHHEGKKAHEDKEQERNSKIDKKEQELPNNQEI